jgi:hypothetical protein
MRDSRARGVPLEYGTGLASDAEDWGVAPQMPAKCQLRRRGFLETGRPRRETCTSQSAWTGSLGKSRTRQLSASPYSFDQGNARFVALNSNHPTDPAQARWLDTAFDDAGNKWRVCFFHHPLYSSGQHAAESRDVIRPALEPLLARNHVDVVPDTSTSTSASRRSGASDTLSQAAVVAVSMIFGPPFHAGGNRGRWPVLRSHHTRPEVARLWNPLPDGRCDRKGSGRRHASLAREMPGRRKAASTCKPPFERATSRGFTSVAAFEELNSAFVLLGGRPRLERAQVAAPPRSRIARSRIESIDTG